MLNRSIESVQVTITPLSQAALDRVDSLPHSNARQTWSRVSSLECANVFWMIPQQRIVTSTVEHRLGIKSVRCIVTRDHVLGNESNIPPCFGGCFIWKDTPPPHPHLRPPFPSHPSACSSVLGAGLICYIWLSPFRQGSRTVNNYRVCSDFIAETTTLVTFGVVGRPAFLFVFVVCSFGYLDSLCLFGYLDALCLFGYLAALCLSQFGYLAALSELCGLSCNDRGHPKILFLTMFLHVLFFFPPASCCASYWKVYGSGFDKQKNTQKDEETRLRSDGSVGSCSAQNTSDD